MRILGIDPGRSEGERMVEYPPMQIKLAVTGHGHADKDDVLDAAMRELNLDTPPRPGTCRALDCLHPAHRRAPRPLSWLELLGER